MMVNFVNDFGNVWEQVIEDLYFLFFESFGQYGVIGVGEGMGNDFLCFVLIYIVFIEEDVYEFRDGQYWMGVVELD